MKDFIEVLKLINEQEGKPKVSLGECEVWENGEEKVLRNTVIQADKVLGYIHYRGFMNFDIIFDNPQDYQLSSIQAFLDRSRKRITEFLSSEHTKNEPRMVIMFYPDFELGEGYALYAINPINFTLTNNGNSAMNNIMRLTFAPEDVRVIEISEENVLSDKEKEQIAEEEKLFDILK